MNRKALNIAAPQSAKVTAPKALVVQDLNLTSQVDKLASLKAELDRCDTEIDAIRATLDPHVVALRAVAEGDGLFTKQVHVKGSGVDARYTFKDAYAPIEMANGPDLARLLGPLYDLLFSPRTVVSLVESKAQELAQLLGPRASEFLKVEDEIRPVAEFRKARFEARDLLTNQQNAELDRVVKAVSAKPTLNLK